MKMPIIAANWKLHKSPALTRRYFTEFLDSTSEEEQAHSAFFPPAISLEAAADSLEGTSVGFGAQNCWSETEGAFTGENSVAVVSDLGAEWVLVGHSERREIFGEDHQLLSAKMKSVAHQGLAALYCIGEKLEDREAGNEVSIWTQQLKEVLSDFDTKANLAIAYEPVWAIGTGKVAEPAQVEAAHKKIRNILTEMHGSEWAKKVPLLYGGSVKPGNASELASIQDVNGFLVGGASLEVDSFTKIIAATLKAQS